MGKVITIGQVFAGEDPSLLTCTTFSRPARYHADAAVHAEDPETMSPDFESGFAGPRECTGPALYMAALRNCYITPSGAVITSEGNLIEESCYPYHGEKGLNLAFAGQFSIASGTVNYAPPPDVRTERALFYMREHGENGFFHWVHSVWPRLMAAHAVGVGPSVPILSSYKAKYQQESFRLSGIDPDRIRRVVPDETIFAEVLLFPSALVIKGDFWSRPPQLMSFFDGLRLPERSERMRIFISRSPDAARAITNESELWAALEKRGFTSIRLEEIPFAEQASLMRSADFVIGAHGAGLSHISFMKPSSSVLEILSPKRYWQTYRALSARRGVKYGVAVGDPIELPNADANSPFSVDVGKVMDVLDQMDGRRSTRPARAAFQGELTISTS